MAKRTPTPYFFDQESVHALTLLGVSALLIVAAVTFHTRLYYHTPIIRGRGKHPHAPDTGTVPGDTGTYSSAPIRKVKFS